MNEIPVWTIVLAIIAFLVNCIIGLLIWSVSQKLGDIKESIAALIAADRAMGEKMGALSKELSDHKLHVSETYVRLDQHNANTTAIFTALRQAKDEIVERVQELIRHVEDRMSVKMGRQ